MVGDIPDQTINEGESFATIDLDDYVEDAEDPVESIIWSYFDDGDCDLMVSIVDRVVTISIPNSDWNGVETITFNATDTGGLYDTDDATFTVSAVNDPPINTVPGAQIINEDTALTFSSANSNQISISDVDAGTEDIKVTLTATQGTLTLSSTTGLTFSTGDGTDDPSMIFTGAQIDINTALNGLTFTPTLDYYGSADTVSYTHLRAHET